MLKTTPNMVVRSDYRDWKHILACIFFFVISGILILRTLADNADQFGLLIFWMYILLLTVINLSLIWSMNKYSSKQFVVFDKNDGLIAFSKKFWGPRRYKHLLKVDWLAGFESSDNEVRVVLDSKCRNMADKIILFRSASKNERDRFCQKSNQLLANT